MITPHRWISTGARIARDQVQFQSEIWGMGVWDRDQLRRINSHVLAADAAFIAARMLALDLAHDTRPAAWDANASGSPSAAVVAAGSLRLPLLPFPADRLKAARKRRA